MSSRKNPSSNATVISGSDRRFSRKRVLVVFICLLVAGSLFAAFYFFYDGDSEPNELSTPPPQVCNEKLIDEASANLSLEKTASLKKTVERIKSLSEYDKDPSCVYIVLVYHLNASEVPDARTAANQLFTISGFEQYISPYLKSLGAPDHNREAIEESIRAAEARYNEAQNNSLEFDRSE